MYWFRADNSVIIFVWILVTLIHTIGGWLIVTHVFCLPSRERLLTGFGIGLILYLWFCNFLGRWLDSTLAFVLSAVIVLGIGIVVGWFSARPFLNWEDFKIWPWFLSGFTLIWVFLRVSKGTGMFDEYKNLALISVIANGEIPVRVYYGLPELYPYHYGYHIWGASMMRLGGFMPWSAFDLSKSIIWGYTILLAGLLGMRYIQGRWGAVLMGVVTTFAGGTRYLMLLLPTGILIRLNDTIQLLGVSQYLGSFLDALKSGWLADGTPPVDYPFAFLSGINLPYVMAHTGSGTLGLTLLFLFLLLVPNVKKSSSVIFLTLFLSFWALTAEANFVLICFGVTLYILWRQLHINPNPKYWKQENKLFLISIFLAMIISFTQGGTITAMIQGFLVEDQTQSISIVKTDPTSQPNDFLGFSVRWPPAVLSAHLGTLPILSPLGIIVAIFEMGVIILYLPWLTKQILRTNPSINLADRILIISAWIGIVLPIFIIWKSDRDITRLTGFGMTILTYLSLIYLNQKEQGRHTLIYQFGMLSLALMTFSGLVLAGTQLTAAPDTIYSEKYKDFDAKLLGQVWGKIPQGSKILGPIGKGSILTGQLTAGIQNYPAGGEREIWQQLRAKPSFYRLIENGFEFVYFDSETDESFMDEVALQDCASIFGYAEDGSGENYAGFYDLRGCYPP